LDAVFASVPVKSQPQDDDRAEAQTRRVHFIRERAIINFRPYIASKANTKAKMATVSTIPSIIR
jgi:hypothetical protein